MAHSSFDHWLVRESVCDLVHLLNHLLVAEIESNDSLKQADRGCAAGDVFVGGEGAFGQKGL